jgi:hypothetical protein
LHLPVWVLRDYYIFICYCIFWLIIIRLYNFLVRAFLGQSIFRLERSLLCYCPVDSFIALSAPPQCVQRGCWRYPPRSNELCLHLSLSGNIARDVLHIMCMHTYVWLFYFVLYCVNCLLKLGLVIWVQYIYSYTHVCQVTFNLNRDPIFHYSLTDIVGPAHPPTLCAKQINVLQNHETNMSDHTPITFYLNKNWIVQRPVATKSRGVEDNLWFSEYVKGKWLKCWLYIK